jgi:acetyltransferase-like isoleucine patch superfamily enzyme
VGYVQYAEKIAFEGMELVKINNGGIKTSIEAGFDIRIGKNVFFGPKIAITSGSVPIDIVAEDYNESLNAIEIGAGFRF